MDDALKPRWYAVRTATRREHKTLASVRELFREQGWGAGSADAYLPCETRWRRHANTKTPKDVPLLAGYLFVWLSPSELWRVEETYGVYRVLDHAREDGRRVPSRIPEEFVDELRLAQAEGKFDRTRAKGLKIDKGDKVRVTTGPFQGWVGEIAAMKGGDRVTVLLSMIGGKGAHPASLTLSQLEKAA